MELEVEGGRPVGRPKKIWSKVHMRRRHENIAKKRKQ